MIELVYPEEYFIPFEGVVFYYRPLDEDYLAKEDEKYLDLYEDVLEDKSYILHEDEMNRSSVSFNDMFEEADLEFISNIIS